jgi:hypothetical protein
MIGSFASPIDVIAFHYRLLYKESFSTSKNYLYNAETIVSYVATTGVRPQKKAGLPSPGSPAVLGLMIVDCRLIVELIC